MADVRWIKIVTDIFDDEKILLIESMPEADSIIVIWFKLLCLAGKQNNSGVFVMSNGIPYTEKMLSTIFRRKETVITLALQTFEQFGMIEIVDETITIPKWGKHQNLDKIEAKNEYQRRYMSDYRKRQKQLVEQIEGEQNSKPNRNTNCKPNDRANVSSLDKIRIDKIRIDKIRIDIFEGRNFSESIKNAINDWLTYKSERREAYKPTGLKSLLTQIENKLKSWSEDHVMLAISESMARNYQGIIWDLARRERGDIHASSIRNSEQSSTTDRSYDLTGFTMVGEE